MAGRRGQRRAAQRLDPDARHATARPRSLRWDLINAWPSEWRGAPLDALGREVAIESLTLVFETLAARVAEMTRCGAGAPGRRASGDRRPMASRPTRSRRRAGEVGSPDGPRLGPPRTAERVRRGAPRARSPTPPSAATPAATGDRRCIGRDLEAVPEPCRPAAPRQPGAAPAAPGRPAPSSRRSDGRSRRVERRSATDQPRRPQAARRPSAAVDGCDRGPTAARIGGTSFTLPPASSSRPGHACRGGSPGRRRGLDERAADADSARPRPWPRRPGDSLRPTEVVEFERPRSGVAARRRTAKQDLVGPIRTAGPRHVGGERASWPAPVDAPASSASWERAGPLRRRDAGRTRTPAASAPTAPRPPRTGVPTSPVRRLASRRAAPCAANDTPGPSCRRRCDRGPDSDVDGGAARLGSISGDSTTSRRRL